MRETLAVFRREFAGYFATPLATVFIVLFLGIAGVFTFYIGGFLTSERADLRPFFGAHPWIYLFFMSAIAMRLWAEERKTGTLELLLTLPVPLWAAVLGKFLAAWVFAGLALALTFPIWITANYLGNPDNGVIFASYIGSWLMAGGYIAIGSCISATTSNQVIAFVVSVVISFLFTLSGMAMVLDFFSGWAPQLVVSAIASFSVLAHFNSVTTGVIEFRDVIYFFSLIALWLTANAVVVDLNRAG